MDKRVAVLYKDKLAQYRVSEGKNGRFIARLLSYNGRNGEHPPDEIEVHKVGRRWEDEGADQNLVDDIGNAIDHESIAPQQPVYHSRSNEGRENSERSDRQRSGGKP